MKNNLVRSQRFTFLVLIILGIIYFAIFVFPNSTGAKDVNMLSVFEHDEFAQYPHVIRMLTAGDSFYQSVRNFVVYLHYYYGYPFYFFSAIAILPIKILLGSGWADHTSLVVTVLRQVINVLPMILAVGILVWMQTRFKSLINSIILFLLLLTIPAVVSNNMWWHPDSLLTLFSVATIFCLVRDDFRFGRNFYFSGIACGLAVGAKLLGVLFVLPYAVYILYGIYLKRITIGTAILRSIIILVVLISTVVITNPLLLLPIERSEIITIFKLNLQQNTQGFWVVGNSAESMFAQVASSLSENYSLWIIVLISLAAAIIGTIKKDHRTKSMIILSWTISYIGYFLVFSSTLRSHYLIPAVLPSFSCLGIFLLDSLNVRSMFSIKGISKSRWKMIGSGVLVFLLILQIVLNTKTDVKNIGSILNREQSSPSIKLYTLANKQVLSSIVLDRKIKIYRDWRAYVAPDKRFLIIYNWDLADYEYIRQENPDVLFIENDNMVFFSDPAKIESAVNPEKMKQMVAFYSDALNGHVEGYQLVLKTGFGSVFLSDIFPAD